jgi:nitrogen fixation-related uncharacterized protein
MRQIQTNIDGIKTKLGQLLIGPAQEALNWVNEFLGKLMPEEKQRTVLDDFNDIEIDTENKMADLDATYEKAKDIIKLIEEINKQTVTLKDGSTITFEELFKDLGNVEKNGGNVRDYIESLGLDVDSVITKYKEWKHATKELVNTVPELSSAIDEETGSIDGGTTALQKNLDEWKKYEEEKLEWAAYYAKMRALEASKENLYLIQYTAGVAEQKVDKAAKALKNKYKDIEFDASGKITSDFFWSMPAEQYDEYKADEAHYNVLLDERTKATANLATQTEDLAAAEEYVAEEKQKLIDKYGEESAAAHQTTGAVTSAEEEKQEAIKTKALTVLPELKLIFSFFRLPFKGNIYSFILTYKS